MKIFTWNVHGGYLSMFSKMDYDLYIPVKDGRPYNWDGITSGYEWSKNAHEIRSEEIENYDYDVILFQTAQHIFEEQYQDLMREQREKAKKYFIVHSPLSEKDLENPNLKELEKLIYDQVERVIHISQFTWNQWNDEMSSLKDRSIVIYHTIPQSNIRAKYRKKSAVTAINDLPVRVDSGRDIFIELKNNIDIDLYGKNSKEIGGLGDISHDELLDKLSEYSIYCNPTIKNPLPMTLLEAMSIGLPVLAMNTTDMPHVITNGEEGFLCDSAQEMIDRYNYLIKNLYLIQNMGDNAINKIRTKFSVGRFKQDWDNVFQSAGVMSYD